MLHDPTMIMTACEVFGFFIESPLLLRLADRRDSAYTHESDPSIVKVMREIHSNSIIRDKFVIHLLT